MSCALMETVDAMSFSTEEIDPNDGNCARRFRANKTISILQQRIQNVLNRPRHNVKSEDCDEGGQKPPYRIARVIHEPPPPRRTRRLLAPLVIQPILLHVATPHARRPLFRFLLRRKLRRIVAHGKRMRTIANAGIAVARRFWVRGVDFFADRTVAEAHPRRLAGRDEPVA